MTVATKLQFERLLDLINKSYGWQQDDQLINTKKDAKGKIPKHEHNPETCQLYGCTKIEDELKRQLLQIDNTGFNFVVERFSGILNRLLLSMTFANSPHDYM